MALRCTRQSVQVLAGGVGAARVERQMLEALAEGDGLLRVSRQSAQILAAGIGKARVERQMIEVLATEITGQVYDVGAENTLSLTTSSGSGFIRTRSVTTELALFDEGYPNLEGYGELSFTDTVAFSGVWNRIAPSENTLDQDLGVAIFRHRYTSSAMTLTQTLEYVGPKQESATTTVALGQIAYRCQTLIVSAQSALSLTTSTIARGTIRASASNALGFLSLADHRVYVRTAASELPLSDAAVAAYCHVAKSTLSLSSAVLEGQIFVKATSPLSLVQSARTNPLTAGPGPEYDFYLPPTVIDLQQTVAISIHILAAQSVLAMADSLGVKRPWYKSAESKVQTVTQVFDPVTKTLVDTISGLRDSATVARLATIPFVNHHYLQLGHNTSVVRIKAGGLDASAGSVLELDYELFTNVTGAAVSHLVLAVQAAADRCAPLTNLLDLVQAAGANINRLREASSALLLMQGLAYSLANNPVFYNYSPFIGEGAPGAPAPPLATLAGPLTGVTVPFQLFYPATGPTASVTLRCPNLGNKDRLSFNRVLRETRGGTLICYADPMWPKIQTLVLSFSGLKAAEKDELLEFLEDHLGLEIGLLDWEHRYWKGVVVTPNDPAVQDDRDSFSVSFEFEGEMDPEWTP